ncbi:MAG: biotin--[acetyl-CoA-carboxylase] ligase [Bacillota bacterium]|nr:biotin--[acetyl-CoA-carboxylase] ligase [Bacillota bacterium]
MKDQVLNLLRQQREYRSGAEISALLGVSRTAVWKMINQLRQDGHLIDAATNRGYLLIREADILSQQAVLEALQDHRLDPWISQVFYLPTADSTNLMARRAADIGAPDKSLFIAGHQQYGRGRRGRTWISDPELNLTFSLLLRPAAQPQDLAPATLFAGLCTAVAMNELLAEQGTTQPCPDPVTAENLASLSILIKWPNDLVSARSGKKICGILTEMIVEENQVVALIVGIGINLNSNVFPPELQPSATSVLLEFATNLRRIDVLCQVVSQFARRYHEMTNQQSWLGQYRQYCQTLGRQVRILTADGQEQLGEAIDIDAEGELVIIDAAGQRKIVRSGEVSVRGLSGYAPEDP